MNTTTKIRQKRHKTTHQETPIQVYYHYENGVPVIDDVRDKQFNFVSLDSSVQARVIDEIREATV